MTSKKFKPGFVPRPTKTLLTALAAKQHEADAAKEQAKAEPEVLAIVDAGEATPSDVATVTEVLAPPNDGAAAPEQASVQAPGTEQAAAPSPTPAAGKPPKGTNDGQYTIGKKYNPKTDRNSETWGKITRALAEGPKTMKELTEVVKGHNDFLGYMTRNGHIIPYKVEATVSG